MINQASTTHSVSPKSDIFKSDGLFCENITPLCTTKKKKKKKKARESKGILVRIKQTAHVLIKAAYYSN